VSADGGVRQALLRLEPNLESLIEDDLQCSWGNESAQRAFREIRGANALVRSIMSELER
jgi:hypothetical protein